MNDILALPLYLPLVFICSFADVPEGDCVNRAEPKNLYASLDACIDRTRYMVDRAYRPHEHDTIIELKQPWVIRSFCAVPVRIDPRPESNDVPMGTPPATPGGRDSASHQPSSPRPRLRRSSP